MTRLRALNESSSEESEEENEERETIEAQEERAFSLYKKALELRQQGHYSESEELLISLLNDDFLANVSPDDHSAAEDGIAHPAAALKYACLKNLGNILVSQKRIEDGLKCFIQAVELDESDVTTWHQIGKVALQIDGFQLACHAFQEGLRCNPRHWPCLDSLLPIQYALNDYLGCLLLVSRALELDPEYPQALALRDQICKEDPTLIENFKYFFPDEKDVAEVMPNLQEDEASSALVCALSYRDRYRIINSSQNNSVSDQVFKKLTVNLQKNTWEDLGKSLLQTYRSVLCSSDKSLLAPVEIVTSSKIPEMETINEQIDMLDKLSENNAIPSAAVDVENEVIDVDSEQDAKGEDQTEDDVTEVSGLEQEEEPKVTKTVQQDSSALKRKRKRSSITLMDQWSKRRSGRRAGRKNEDREESNLASCFRSILPDSLLPKDLEAEIAKASRRRLVRDPAELLAWGDDSMDTVELCRLLQERDEKNEHKRQTKQSAKEIYSQRVLDENYFGTDKEISDICEVVEKFGCGTLNIIVLLKNYVMLLAEKHSFTWPPNLGPIFVELYECMRKNVPCPSPFNSVDSKHDTALNLFASLLYCELSVDLWKQKRPGVPGDDTLLAESLGYVIHLSAHSDLFSSFAEQCKSMIRAQWSKVHIFLLQENSPSAINSLQDVLEIFEVLESEETPVNTITGLHISKEVNTPSVVLLPNAEQECSSVKENLHDTKCTSPENEMISKSPESSSVLVLEEQNNTGVGVVLTSCLQENDSKKSDSLDVGVADSTVKFNCKMEVEEPETICEGEKEEKLVTSSDSSVPLTMNDNLDTSVVMVEVPMKDENETSPSTDHPPQIKEEKIDVVQEECGIQKENCESVSTGLNAGGESVLEECIVESELSKSSVGERTDELNTKNVNSSAKGDLDAVIEGKSVTDHRKQQSLEHERESNHSHISLNVAENSQSVERLASGNVGQTNEGLPVSASAHESVTEVFSDPVSSIVSLKKMTNDNDDQQVILEKCSLNQDINKRVAQKLLTSLTRQQQLSEVDDLYISGQYEILASTLTECFKYCAQQTDCENPEIDNMPDRPTQMAMLLDSLWQLKRYSDCFYWTEACLHEAFNRYLSSTDGENASQDQDDHQMWATTVERLLAGLSGCLKAADTKLLETLPKTCLTRLVQTLSSILCQQLEQSDCSVEMAIECTTPWIILHRVIYFEEQQFPITESVIPSYMSVLFTAHEYMAKKARCCLNEGALLNLILDVVVPQIRSPDLREVRHKLNNEVEQAILCLYGHPKKPTERSKKKLQDHKIHQQFDLTWERSLLLMKFYEPDELPAFDSVVKISPDEEQLFLRILQLVPSDCNPSRYLGKMKAFLKGDLDTLPDVHCSIPDAARNLYYLLAYCYYKSFKWEAAIKYFLLDVCVNPKRFDSWAGMALSLGTLLVLDLNSCDTVDKDLQLRRKTKAQQCFELAMDLEPENVTLLIEYGNFAYYLHSFCSRLLKTDTNSLSIEMFTKIEEEKDKMLTTTEKCFRAAEKLDHEEGWLPQYMLGKVAEKRGESPMTFLQHYRSAARLLFESSAEYPLSLNYDPPQHYAFEAHEVHYRIHASILKNLELMEEKVLSAEIENLYSETLDEAAKSPFMAARASSQLSLNSKRVSLDPAESVGKKLKLDKSAVGNNAVEDCNLVKEDLQAGSQQIVENTDEKVKLQGDQAEVNMQNRSSPGLLCASNSAAPSSLVKSQDAIGENSSSKSDKVRDENPDASSNVQLNTSAQAPLSQEISGPSSNLEGKSEDLHCKDVNQLESPPFSLKSGTCDADSNKSKTAVVNIVARVGPEIELNLLTNNKNLTSVASNSVRIGALMSGVGNGFGCFGRDKYLHGMTFVVAEHDYAAPYSDAEHKTTQGSTVDSFIDIYEEAKSQKATRDEVCSTLKKEILISQNSKLSPFDKGSDTVNTEKEKISHESHGVSMPSFVLHDQNGTNSMKSVENNFGFPKEKHCQDLTSQSMKGRIQLIANDVIDINIASSEMMINDGPSVEGCVNPSVSSSELKTEETSLTKKGSTKSDNGSSSESENMGNNRNTKSPGKNIMQDSTKDLKDVTALSTSNESVTKPTFIRERNSDHSHLVNQCISGIEECLVRYPRHYKSLYRLCHYFFHSKKNHNLRKCRQLLLGDYRVMQVNKNINGLFKGGSVNSMFNDVWRIPIEEIDRAGSFASHMSRCVHLLMELLRSQRDHAYLLKLSIFLKRDPEKKDKKYLRDNERADLSMQALVMCITALRDCVNETRTVDQLIELFRSVKEGIKEMPAKEGTFKNLLSDAFKKLKGFSQTEQSFYEDAVSFCQSELNLRKAAADAKVKAQAQLQAQLQAQVHTQVQAQVQAQAMQMGVNTMNSTLPFNPRFPTANTTLGNSLASQMFLPQMPVYRGRGRPPKAQQRLHNAMMNMAQIIGFANTSPSVSGPMNLPKPKKQRRAQQPVTSSGPSTVVSSIIKDRPALSITTLPNAAAATTTTPSGSGAASRAASPMPMPVNTMPFHPMDILPSGQAGWQQRPRHSYPRPMNTVLPGTTDPRSGFGMTAVRRDGPRPKAGLGAARASSSLLARPQSNTVPSNPADLLSRLPGLQVNQRPTLHQQGYGTYSEQPKKPSKSQEREATSSKQQLERLQKLHLAAKSALSISKISAPLPQGGQGSSSTETSESKKKNDPNFDIITLD